MSAASARLLRIVLVAVLIWSVLLFMLSSAGLGGRYSLHPDDPTAIEALPAPKLERAETRLQAFDQYAEVADRPLFSPDRRPQPGADTAAPIVDAAPPAAPLDFVLTSVVMAGDTRLAVVSDSSGNSQTVRVGQHPTGEQAAWQLVEVHARHAVFEGPTGRSRIDLRVFDGTGGQAPTPIAMDGTDPAGNGGVVQVATEEGGEPGMETPESRAEMIRKRIEERRRQMREEAARANQERGQ